MTGTKSFLQSTSIWGALVAIIALGFQAFGYTFSEADQATVADGIAQIAQFAGILVAIYGRVRATKQIAPAK